MTNVSDQLKQPLAQLVLGCADDKLFLGHRNSDWTGLGPILEEDIAFSSLAQDNMAHAQALYALAGELTDQTADHLAFGRNVSDYRCAQIVEAPDQFDYATAIARQLFCSHFDRLRFDRLAQSSYTPLAQLAARIAAEEQVQVDHVDGWVERLGRGSAQSNARVQQALDGLAPLAAMLFEAVTGESELVEAGIYPGSGSEMFDAWASGLVRVTVNAGLDVALTPPSADAVGGRRGAHSEHLQPLLDEMCEVYRLEPNAAW